MKSIVRAIQDRHSVRNYCGKQIEDEKLKKLKDFMSRNNRGPFENIVRFGIVDASDYNREQLKKLGVYEIMRGADLFIAGAVSIGECSMEDFGYCMEKNILMATSLGLGTCWMGGMLNRSTFAAKLNITNNEIIPAITPIGYEGDKKTFGSQALGFLMGSSKRKPFGEIFFHDDLSNPLEESDCEEYAKVLECVRWAPSAGNMQPWRVVRERGMNIFHFYQKERALYNNNQRYEGTKLQNVDMGIAMCHFELAAIELGLKGNWKRIETKKEFDNLKYITTWL